MLFCMERMLFYKILVADMTVKTQENRIPENGSANFFAGKGIFSDANPHEYAVQNWAGNALPPEGVAS